jgi:diketogulonate reductase-like aldo/keto reductase
MIGGRKIEHLQQNIQALEISLSQEQIQRIDNTNPIDLGFPYTVIVRIAIQLPV